MKKQNSRIVAFLVSVVSIMSVSLSSFVFAAAPSDWSAIPSQKIMLHYPGQASYEWLVSKEHKRAGKKTAEGDSVSPAMKARARKSAIR